MKPPKVPAFDLARVAFDLDGTLAEDTWPSPHIGKPIKEGVDLLLFYAMKKKCSVVIYTARPASHKERIWAWVHQHNLQWWVYDVVTDKPIAGLYIDDRAVRFERTEES